MLVNTGALSAFSNDFLRQKYDYVSPDVDSGSIVQSASSGRDGRGGITFVTGSDANDFAYDLYVQQAIPAAGTQIFGIALRQTATQHDAGGRLLTLVDGGEDVFGETTQVGINLLPDGTLQAVRANVTGTGIVLRGLDQSGDSQVTLLGESDTAVDAADVEFVVIQVFHNSAVGSITATFYNDAGEIKGTWSLTDVNTAVSGRDQSTSFCYGGYASTNLAGDARFHNDLQAVISDLYVVNNVVNPDDSRDPVSSLGNRKPSMVTGEAAGTDSEWTPDPTQANYLNVNEIPPDSGDTNNFTNTTDATDSMEMEDVASSDEEAIIVYSAFVNSDVPAECGESEALASFEAFVYMEQSEAGICLTSVHDLSACQFTDRLGRRAQSVCTIASDGEAVRFKPNLVLQDGFWAFLTPLNAPPRVLNADGPSRYTSAVFNLTNGNVQATAAEARYTLPFSQPWAGYAADTQDNLDTSSDFAEFKLSNVGIGLDAVLIDNSTANLFNPYTSPLQGFHFREDLIGSPYFWIGTSFAYNGETTYSYSATDNFKMTRSGGNVQFRQNATLLETHAVSFPTHTNFAVFMGRWGWDAAGIPPAYSLRPGIKQAFVQIGGTDCVQGNYQQLSCTELGTFTGNTGPPEANEWGIQFDPGDGVIGDATVFDKNGPNAPVAPVFGYNEDTECEFSLVGGNVRLTVTGWVDYADNMTSVVGDVATWDYTEPYASTNDFALHAPATGYAVGVPTFPTPALEYAFTDAQANAPLRLGVVCAGDSDYALPEHAGVKDVSFTFVGSPATTLFKGVYQQDGNTRLATEAEAPTAEYRYRQSVLGSTPSDTAITVDDANEAQHGYSKTE